MKKTIALLLCIVTLLCVLVPSYAVENSESADPADQRLDNEYLETHKTVIYNGGDSYTLRLETYVTGETIIKEKIVGIPSDIVLVMDHSNSMKDCIICKDNDSDTKHCYIVYAADVKTDETYYRGESGDLLRYCTTCSAWAQDSSNHFTNNKHTATTYIPKTDKDSSGTNFYKPCAGVTNIIALENAVNNFLGTVYEDAKGGDGVFGGGDDIEHRVAMVSFAGDDGGDNSTNCILSFYDPDHPGDGRLTGPKIPENQVDDIKNDKYFEYYSQHSLQNVTTEDGRRILDNTFENTGLSSSTHTFKGMSMASNILKYDNTYSPDVYASGQRNRVVILFSDGVPHWDGTAFAKSNDALEYSNIIKTEIGATVYSVCVFEGADGSDPWNLPDWSGNVNKANRFMHLVSSNYPNALHCAPGNAGANEYDINPKLEPGDSYFLAANDSESLNKIFLSIYEEINESKAHVSLDTSTVLKDIVSSKFVISGVPTAHSETYNGIVNGIINWVNDNNNGRVGTVNVSGNTVTVTGFDYSEYYVDTKGDTAGHEGKKLVLEIPIKPADNNNGGTELVTNEKGSGIYYPNHETGELEPIEDYKVPKADIPTTITVVKDIEGGNVPAFEFVASVQHLTNYDGNDQSDGNHLDQIDGLETHNFTLADDTDHVITNVAVGTVFRISENVDLSAYDVTVKVTDENGTDITTSVLTVSDGVYTISEVQPSMTVTFTNKYKYTNLTVEKTLDTTDTPRQDFVFEITKADDPSYKLDLVIPSSSFVSGKAAVTIEHILIGSYTVREVSAWSGRYTLTDAKATVDTDAKLSGDSITVDLTLAHEKVAFTNSHTDDLWLTGDCRAENFFADTGVIRKDD